MIDYRGGEVKFYNFNASSAGLNTIVSGIAGKSFLVLLYSFIAAGDVLVSFESTDGTIHDGPLSVTNHSGMATPESAVGQFKTTIGSGLAIFLSGAVQVGGKVVGVFI